MPALQELASQAQALAALRAQVGALSEAAAQKEEDLRRFKVQLIKAKKLRQQDAERWVVAHCG